MNPSDIINAVVRFTIEGIDAVTAAVTTVSSKFSDLASKAPGLFKDWFKPWVNSLRSVFTELTRIARMGTSLAMLFGAGGRVFGGLTGGGGGFAGIRSRMNIGGILAEGFRGAREIDDLSAAFQRFSRVLSAEFAPYIRMATQALKELTEWWRTLDAGLKANLVKWGLIVAGIGLFITVMGPVIALISSLITLFASLIMAIVNPIGLAIIAITAIVVNLAILFGFMETEGPKAANAVGEANKNWVQALADGIDKLSNGFKIFWYYLTGGFKKAFMDIKSFWADTMDYIEGTWDHLKFLMGGMTKAAALEADRKRFEAQFDRESKSKKEWDDWVEKNRPKLGKGVGDFVKSLTPDQKTLQGFMAALRRITGAAGGPGFAYGKPSFESSDQVWDRLVLAGANQENIGKAQLDEAKKSNDWLQQAVDALGRMLGVVPAVR